MLSITPAGITYRTKCLPQPQAERFARCVDANPLFTDVSLNTSTRAKGERCHFVTFRPVNPDRQQDMAVRQQLSREERAMSEGSAYVWALDKDGGRPFFWLMSASGEVYEVDLQGRSCSCPDFQYRCEGAGLECKHIQALRNGLGTFADFQPVPESRIPEDAVAELDGFHEALDDATPLPEPEPGLDAYDSWARCYRCGRLTDPKELAKFHGGCANCICRTDDACARLHP